ncbi:MAG: hypothetical protein COW84_05620 [Gammaproteobacteria bacterium CG22_combo_CG10-13_8_21_14_all_40_8]|nr:MAG: hypothetical protein COW84_05620 [Gammaproteobacteria bacterium CG22_combo_CG10-13_8_21_14_all_40_8]
MFTGDGWSFWIVWTIYTSVGLIVLAMLRYPMRRANRWLQLLLLIPVATLMFTPLTIQPESEYWAPAALVMIFEIEEQGMTGMVRGLIPLILTYLGLMLIGISILFTKSKKSKQNKEMDSSQRVTKKQTTLDDLSLDE